MERRTFLKGTLAGAIAVGFGSEGCGPRRGQTRRVFSDTEAATLEAIAARVVAPLDARELRIADKIDSLLAAADDVTQRDLRRLLWLFGSIFGSLFFQGRLARFVEMGPAEQDAVLT